VETNERKHGREVKKIAEKRGQGYFLNIYISYEGGSNEY
jgi:hypothetical protein